MAKSTCIFATLVAAAALMVVDAQACTRVVYHGPNNTYLTGRSMDFKDPIVSNLWVFPRGMKRHGAAGPRSVEWTSSYGSLIVSGYEISAVGGMNEAGLNANLLWLANAKYPEDDGVTPRMSLAIWAQYFLDQFATVEEAVVQSDDPRIAAAATFSIVRNVSEPYGISLPDAPNLSTTRWRIVADHKNKRFYAESATSPNIFWVDLKHLDFSQGSQVRTLDLGVDMSRTLAGEVSGQFVPAQPFTFMEAQ